MNKALKILLLLFVLPLACQNKLKIKKKDIITNKEQTTFVYNTFLNQLDELRMSLTKQELPEFLYDDCFVCNCFISVFSSGSRIHCFQSMLDSLNVDEISFLAHSKDSILLMKKCQDKSKCKYESDMDKSRWDDIKYVYRKKQLLNSLHNHFSRGPIHNQNCIDTSSFFVDKYRIRGNVNQYTVFKLYSNGTFSKYILYDESRESLDKNCLIESGQYYVSENCKQVILETIEPDNDYTKPIVVQKTYLIKNSGIERISIQRSNSKKIIFIGGFYRKYKKLIFK